MARRPRNIVPIGRARRGRSWTRASDYLSGAGGPGGRKPRRGAGSKGRLARWLSTARPITLLFALVTVWFVVDDAALIEPPRFLLGDPEKIAGAFTRCGIGRGYYCVIDGDTFKIGQRSIRVVGIDAPEVKAQCSAEAAAAERATAALQAWLNRASFRMTARLDQPRDRYDRELRIVTRLNPNGSSDRLADQMRATGHARRYLGGWRGGWC